MGKDTVETQMQWTFLESSDKAPIKVKKSTITKQEQFLMGS